MIGLRRLCGPLLLVLGAGCLTSSRGCDPGWGSEEQQVAFYDGSLIIGAEGYFENQGPMLVGTITCPAIDCLRPEAEGDGDPPADLCPANPDEPASNADLLACFSMSIDGPGMLDGDCLTLSAPGLVTWNLTPQSCPAESDGFAPVADRTVLEVVAPDGLRAWFRPEADLRALAELEPAPGTTFPEDAVRQPGDAVFLLADTQVRLPITLEDADSEQAVAWQRRLPSAAGGGEAATLSVEALAGAPAEVVLGDEGTALVTIEAGARSRLELVIMAAATFDLGVVEGVAPEDVESMELAVGYGAPEEGDDTAPAGARAILRDGAGTPVYGAHIEWEVVDGRLGLNRTPDADGETDPGRPDCEYMALAGDCFEEPKRAEKVGAVLVARWEELEASQTLEWTIRPGRQSSFWDPIIDLFGGDSADRPTTYACEGPGLGGCGCTAGPLPAADLAPQILALGGILAVSRPRRRRQRIGTAATLRQ